VLGVGQASPAEQPAPAPGRPNLIVEIQGPRLPAGLARVTIQVRAREGKAPTVMDLHPFRGGLVGSVHLAPGKAQDLTVTVLDGKGRPTHRGRLVGDLGAEQPVSLGAELRPLERGDPLALRLSSYRLEIDRIDAGRGRTRLRARAVNPDGSGRRLGPDDFTWGVFSPTEHERPPFGVRGDEIPFPPDTPEPDGARLCFPSTMVFACTVHSICTAVDACADPFVSVTAGNGHACALTRGGVAYCWGSNSFGQLGTAVPPGNCTSSSTCVARPTPVACPPGSPCRFKQLAAGGSHTCAVDVNDDAWCWGGSNYDGELGGPRDGGASWSEHVRVGAGVAGFDRKFLRIAAGQAFTCAITRAASATGPQRQVYCWGSNGVGALGLDLGRRADGTPEDHTQTPRQVTAFPYSILVTGTSHTCVVTTDGFMRCWGDNGDQQVADGKPITPAASCTSCTIVPVDVAGALGRQVARAAAGGFSSCAAFNGGATHCWGRTPVDLPPGPPVASLSTHDTHGCAVTSAGTTTCWGDNRHLELGGGALTDRGPRTVALPEPLAQVSAGSDFTCGVSGGGQVYCWGANQGGQLGRGQPTPTPELPGPVLPP
jgi:alpha-tubulin suppressor-like RCC1 family protein